MTTHLGTSTTTEDLDELERKIVDALDPADGLLSVVLMGSVAKRTPARDPTTGRIVSDIDAIVVVPTHKFPSLVARQRALAERLSRATGLAASVAPITPGMLRRAPPSVWFAELKFGGRTIWGRDMLENIRIPRIAGVDPSQSIIVGLNYLQELACVRPSALRTVEPEHVAKLARCGLALSDAYTALTRQYSTSIETRVAITQAAIADPAAKAVLESAWILRTRPTPVDEAGYGTLWARTRDALRSFLLQAAKELEPTARNAEDALRRAVRDDSGLLVTAQAVALRTAQTRSLGPALRPQLLAPSRVRLELYEAMSDPIDEARLDDVLARWRAASPAFRLFG